MYHDGTMVQDPLVLLELSEMRCGHVARVAVDLFSAAGYKGRLVQLGGHVIAEIQYDAKWHYFDGDIFGNGESVFLEDGSIPSVVELSNRPFLIDSLASNWEPDNTNTLSGESCYPSWFYFARAAYDGACPIPVCYYEKTATPEEEKQSRCYGWERYETVLDKERVLFDDDLPKLTPCAPTITKVEIAEAASAKSGVRTVLLVWSVRDTVGVQGPLEYRIYVSGKSRGWNYDGQSLPTDLMKYKSRREGWKPNNYEARFTLPGKDIAFVTTTESQERLVLPKDKDCFITVIPVDKHGAIVGRKIYPMSEEILILK